MVVGADGAEVDWFIGYGPPPESFRAKLEKILKGENTFKAVSASYAENPKDAAVVFLMARKWGDRFDDAKSTEFYKQVIALDPEGKTGSYTNERTGIAVPYTEFAEYTLAAQEARPAKPGEKPDFSALRAFIAKYPNGKMTKDGWRTMGYYYASQASREEAVPFFEEYAGKYPADPAVLGMWLDRIMRDKGPMEKGAELAEKILELTEANPSPAVNLKLAQFYGLKGDKAKAERLYGPEFMTGRVEDLAYELTSYANYWASRNENLDSAVAMAEQALRLMPDDAYFIQQAAQTYVRAGREAEALAIFGPAYAQKNGGDDGALYRYASFWVRQGKNLDSALSAAKKSVELKGSSYSYWMGLGSAYEKLKNYPEAIKAAEKAIELAPEAVKENYQKALERLKSQK